MPALSVFRYLLVALLLLSVCAPARAAAGGRDLPNLVQYKCYFDDQLGKQVSSAVARAVGAGKSRIEVQLPPVPNVEEVRFGTPFNQRFGTQVVARDLAVPGGYQPGSNVSRNLLAYSNMAWAKKIAGSLGKTVAVLTAEPVDFDEIRRSGMGQVGPLRTGGGGGKSLKGKALIAVNPGGEEQWERIQQAYGDPRPFVILNNAYSTMYGLGNKRGFEEAYYLKRISKGWVYRAFPGPWQAFLEKPDGKVELLCSYKTKPELKEVATLVREESFARYAITNDRWMSGRL